MASQVIEGTSGNDVIVADKVQNWVNGNAGHDTVTFHADGGTVFGGKGNDTFHMSPPGVAQVHAYGGLGDDTFYIDTSDRVAPYGVHAWGGEGSDKFVFTNVEGGSTQMSGRLDDFDPSRDEIWVDDKKIDLQDLPQNVRLVSHQDQPWLLIDDRALYAVEGARSVTNDASNLAEEVHFINWPAAWKSGVPESANISYEDFVSYFPKNEMTSDEASMSHIRGTSGNDAVTGTDGGEYIHGGNGFDTLNGGGGDDVIDGEDRNDLIYGGDGNDSLAGGLDQDVIYGGSGNDLAYGGSGHDIVYGEAGNDTLSGNSGNDLIFGGTGNDKINGGTGKDVLLGGAGSDTINGGAGDDLLVADGSNSGTKGDNVLIGGEGNDTLVGADGQTTEMTGGSGKDVFVAAGKGESTVTDFDVKEDKLDLRGQIDSKDELSDHMTRVERGDDSGIADLRIDLDQGGSVLLEGMGDLTADQLGSAVMRDGAAMDVDAAVEQQTDRIEGTPDLSGASEFREDGSHSPNPHDDHFPHQDHVPQDDTPAQDFSSHGGGGCFVATASFGGIDHPDVTWLRYFRDTKLVYHPAGRAFIRFYWTVGPVMARYVNANGPTGRVSRFLLSGLVAGLKRLV